MIIKRIFDIIFSLFFLCILSPILIIMSVLIKIDSPGPVIFKQKRCGKNRVPFYILKFRTMYVNAPDECSAVNFKNQDIYITKFGKFLRTSSLDEILQLFNILKGEMSLVGPRPVLLNEIELINLREKVGANAVRPGLTGWAQINGRNELTMQEKSKFDGEYIEKMCLLFDIKILFKTVGFVLKKKGISAICTNEYLSKEKKPQGQYISEMNKIEGVNNNSEFIINSAAKNLLRENEY